MPAKGKGKDHLPANAKHKSVDDYEDTLSFVADLMVRGYTLSQMREKLVVERKLRVSLVQVHHYAGTIRQRWREPSEQVKADHIELKRKQIQFLYKEALAAWEMSKRPEVVRTVEKVVPLRLKKREEETSKIPERLRDAANKFGQEIDGKKGPAQGTVEADLMVVKEVIRTNERIPSGQFLQIALMCIAAERELDGLDAVLGKDDGLKRDAPRLTWTQRMQALPPADAVEQIIRDKLAQGTQPKE